MWNIPALNFVQGYTPSLIVSDFKTTVSLGVSLIILGGFLTFVAYTSYVWIQAPVGQSGRSECRLLVDGRQPVFLAEESSTSVGASRVHARMERDSMNPKYGQLITHI